MITEWIWMLLILIEVIKLKVNEFRTLSKEAFIRYGHADKPLERAWASVPIRKRSDNGKSFPEKQTVTQI